jgi:hypothetical protein
VSTNVSSSVISSPVQHASRRRRAKNQFIDDEAKEDADTDDPGDEDEYQMDDFVVSDNEESDDAFEPIRKVGQPRREMERVLGPPITVDKQMENVSDLHRAIIDGFVVEAKKTAEKVS